MNCVVIDGQGGSVGKILVEKIKEAYPMIEITAIGTNSIAASNMLKAGADHCATGENPILVACESADLIVGPMGILAANSMLGEITPKMAEAIGKSHAQKILIPISKCKIAVAGVKDMSFSAYLDEAIVLIRQLASAAS